MHAVTGDASTTASADRILALDLVRALAILLVLGLGPQPNRVQLVNGKLDQIDFDLRPAAGGALDLTLRGDALGGWTVADATGPVGKLPAGFFAPAVEDVHVLQVGSRAFVGTIDRFAITSCSSATVTSGASSPGSCGCVRSRSS